MSIRKGYFWLSDKGFDGPFQTIGQAKAEAQLNNKPPFGAVSIRVMVEVERTDDKGVWQTVH
ncbi:hypothetical protein JQ617_08135 [Bradyrhizobium sp. KB893862 SZCCT0404]|uniref:hypothetical protein n=1 Tax=Bradyrhizobium sp. KB893862 SZCCT0404 TaxID=2807672 RepID=UPI001BAA5636|nr:hypothetical protein [Bradyrhizobium sp. KB893862 SZCCT0404]MBR1173919.1 hypothetical protein [Bradyrhizobium sp. KB893862 SZCCT0404]